MEKKHRRRYTLPSYEEGLDVALFWQDKVPRWILKRYQVPDETLIQKLPEWLFNWRVISETIGFDHPLTDLKYHREYALHPKSALVIDQSMASRTFLENLHHIKDYSGLIICCDRALGKVLEYANPEQVMVVQVDSSPLCFSFFDVPIVKNSMEKMVGAVFANTTNPLTIRRWSGRRYYFTPDMGWEPLTYTLALKSGTPVLYCGGEVSTVCWQIAHNLGANPIGIFGILNCYENISETEYPGVSHKVVENKYGKFIVDPVYERYTEVHLGLIRAAKQKYGIITINCTESGIMYSEWVEELTLKEFVEIYQ